MMLQAEGNKGVSKNLGRGNQTTKPKKNTVASLLAQTRRDSDKGENMMVLSPANQPFPGMASSHPELTIEPIFRSAPSQVGTLGNLHGTISSLSPQSPSAAEEEFDQSLGGRRISTYYDSDGKEQLLTYCPLLCLLRPAGHQECV